MSYGQQYQGQPIPQQAYGAPPVGAPYGAPAGQAPAQIPTEIKWNGLEQGGQYKIPVIRFIGRLTDVVADNTPNGLREVFKFDQVQILESSSPWPWATVDVSIKYSSRENSGWGRCIATAKTLGLALNAPTLDAAKADLIGKIYEMHQAEESYGEDDKTGQKFKGDVWHFDRIVIPGAPVQAQPQYAVPPQQPQAQPQYQPPTQVSAPAPANAGTPDLTLLDTDTAPVRAKKLLNGKVLNEFLGAALVDAKIKADAGFINTIYDQSFINGLKASGQVVLGTDGKHRVVA